MKYLVPENPGSPGFEDGEFKIPCDMFFVGSGKGIPYGQAYGTALTWSQAAAVMGTWYEISDAAMTDGNMNYFTHDGSGKLTVALAGTYLISYSVTFASTVAAIEIQTSISISGAESGIGLGSMNAAAANTKYALSGSAILVITAAQTLEVSIRTTAASTPTISVTMLALQAIMVGG